MTQKIITAMELKPGNKLLLPFGKTATVKDVKLGTQFVNIVTEHGKTRMEMLTEVEIESGVSE